MNNALTEMKNTLERVSGITEAEEQINDLEGGMGKSPLQDKI